MAVEANHRRWIGALLLALAWLLADAPHAQQTQGNSTSWTPSITKNRKLQPAGDIVGIAISGDAATTRVTIDATGPIKATAFVVADPFRVVIDVADAKFRLPPAMGADGQGLVSAFRFGLLEVGKSRIVLDATGPVTVSALPVAAVRPAGPLTHLLFEIAAADPATAAHHAVRAAAPTAANAAPALTTDTRPSIIDVIPHAANAKPVIVIDPGHGGLDPGAVAAPDLLEKNVVLGVGRALAAVLSQSGRYVVQLTRNKDVFVPLAERVRLSQSNRADLFISIHADAVAEAGLANSVRGASFYTLAEQASDERARLLAEKENASDTLAGLKLAAGAEGDQVRHILGDLLLRETITLSHEFRTDLVGHLRGQIALAREAQRSGAFKVLRQPASPSVLIELGYMSHAEDQKSLKSPEWQKRVADAIATAVDAYFARR